MCDREGGVLGVVVDVPLVEDGHVLNNGLRNRLRQLRQHYRHCRNTNKENKQQQRIECACASVCEYVHVCMCARVSHLQLANRRRRESLVKLDDRVPFSVIFNLGRVFSEQRHEIVHEQNVTKNTAGLK